MNINLEKIDNMTAKIVVSVDENDYAAKVTEELKKIGRTHTIPGFRKGHVPASQPVSYTHLTLPTKRT